MNLFEIVDEVFGECKVIKPTRFPDSRGFFTPEYREDDFKELGLPTKFVQDNMSRSAKNVFRGLHFQIDPPMGKLMRVTRGQAYLYTVDLRIESPTFLKWDVRYVTEHSMLQVWAPARFARGFYSVEDDTEVRYKCTGVFNATGDKAIRWNDPDIGIGLPTAPLVSERDQNAPTVNEYFWGGNNAKDHAGTPRHQ